MYIFVDFHQSVHKRFQIFYPEHIFYPKFKKKKRLTELSKLMTETQTDSVYRLLLVMDGVAAEIPEVAQVLKR